MALWKKTWSATKNIVQYFNVLNPVVRVAFVASPNCFCQLSCPWPNVSFRSKFCFGSKFQISSISKFFYDWIKDLMFNLYLYQKLIDVLFDNKELSSRIDTINWNSFKKKKIVLVKTFKALICEFLFFGVKSCEFVKDINWGEEKLLSYWNWDWERWICIVKLTRSSGCNTIKDIGLWTILRNFVMRKEKCN